VVSDDTEHTFMLAQALLVSPDDAEAFQRNLARRMRWWLACLPAGVGFATLRAILKLWFGVPASRSGVHSAGNGAAMRSALLGVYFANEPERRRQFVRASTQITHRDPRAEVAAQAVAETATWMTGRHEDLDGLWRSLAALSEQAEWKDILLRLRNGLAGEVEVGEIARELGAKAGVSGYAWQSVPVAIYAALRHRDDYATAVDRVIACGGDTDTVAAITGGLVGARVGPGGIPLQWRCGVCDFPLSLDLLRHVARRLGQQHEGQTASGPVSYFWPVTPLRNLFFLGVVLAHGLRRLLPSY
jgi:ADP-ribosylglycohydrolase